MPQPIAKTPSSPSCSSNTSCCSHFRCILLSILVLVAGFSAGLYIGGQGSSSTSYNPSSLNQPSSQKSEVKKGSYEDGYQAALDFARKKISDMGLFRGYSAGSGKNMLSNVSVKSVSGNSIAVEFNASLLDIFGEGMTTKTIIIPDTVKIEKRIPKDPAEIQKDFDEYRIEKEAFGKTVKAEGQIKDFPVPPSTYISENVNISDIKAGDILNIFYEVDTTKPDTLNAISVELINNPELIQKIKDGSNKVDQMEKPPVPQAPASEDAVKNAPTTDSTPPLSSEAEAAVKNATITNSPAATEPAPVQ